ncbi:MAG: calcium/sodium antiporter [Pseudomonadota bacterium]
MEILLLGLVIGLVLLVLGGEILVRGAVAAATKLGVSSLVIGLTLVGFGTSMPEMVVSVQAVYAGSPGLALGNIVGSNISNILLIVGFSALLLPMAVARSTVIRDGTAVMLATLGFSAICAFLVFDRLVGVFLVLALIGYLTFVFLQERKTPSDATAEEEARAAKVSAASVLFSLVVAIVGMVILVTGGTVLVDSAIAIARRLSVPDEVIGLTIVAIGTSLPELVTAIAAAIKRETDMALGSVLGSNMFNLLSIGGVTTVLAPAPFVAADQIVRFDNFVMLAATVLLLFMAWTRRRIGRVEGAVLFTLYIAYIGTLVWYELSKNPALTTA